MRTEKREIKMNRKITGNSLPFIFMIEKREIKMNRKGIIRIVEATIAILLIFIVLLVIFVKDNQKETEDLTALISPLLEEIAKNSWLREKIINNPDEAETEIDVFLASRIVRIDLGYKTRVCEISDLCSLANFPETRDGNVYSKERVISTYIGNDLNDLNMKKVKVFLWRK